MRCTAAIFAQLRGDAEATATFASQALAELGEDERLLGTSPGATWRRPNGSGAGSRRPNAPSYPASPGWAGKPTITVWGLQILGQVQRAQGRLDAAVLTHHQTLEVTAPPGRPPLQAAGQAYVGLADVAYQRNELDLALRQVTEGMALCRQLAYRPPLASGLTTLAWNPASRPAIRPARWRR